MRACIAPLGSLSLAVARVLASLGHDVFILDSFGRCVDLIESVRVSEKIRLVDAPPSSKPLYRLLRRCEVFILANDPWDMGACGDWERVIVGYAVDTLYSGVERIVALLPAGAYAWSATRVDCGYLPRIPPPVLEYSVPLGVAVLLSSRADSLLVLVTPPLLHMGEGVLRGRPERVNWFERLLKTRVLEARREARLSVLDYRDAGESVALYAESETIGWVCIGGVVVEAGVAAERVGYKDVVPMEPDSIVVEGEGVRRRTLGILESLGIRHVHK